MKILNKKIIKFEGLIQRHPKVKNFIAASLNYYKAYLMGMDSCLSKALGTVVSTYENNPSSVDLILLHALCSIERGSTEKGESLLNTVKPYRNYYKQNEPAIYGLYLYISAILEISSGKEKRTKKSIKLILELKERHDFYLYEVLAGDLYYRISDAKNAFFHMENAFFEGCQSFLMYTDIYHMAKEGLAFNESDLFISFLNWCKNQGVLNSSFLDANKDFIKEIFKDYSSDIEKIYEICNLDWLLIEICNWRIMKRDYSLQSYKYYKKAEDRQLEILYLEKALIWSAHKNGIEDISLYSMTKLIENHKIEDDLLVFVYFMLLTKEKLNNLIEGFSLKKEIMDFAAQSLKKGQKGRLYNSIYSYCLENLDTKYNYLGEELQEILYQDLFLYEAECTEVKSGYLWILENEFLEMTSYQLADGKAYIKSSAGNFTYVLMDESQKVILDNKVHFKRQIENSDIWLYTYFYNKGYENINLYIALSSFCFNLKLHDEKYIDILKKTILLPNLSYPFRIQINAALGNIFSKQDKYDKALEHFKEVDENYLADKDIEIMFLVFIRAKEYERALSLIAKKRELITRRSLFLALREMSACERTVPFLADAAYELILNNYYDKKLLDIVLKYYSGSQRDWIELRNALLNISIDEIKLDEIILKNSIWMHDFSKYAQMVFMSMYKQNPENELIEQFIYYACFEMLINFEKPEYDLIVFLEKLESKDNNRLLTYALSRIYIKYGISTFKSDEIIKKAVSYMEEDSIILPEFINLKDKTFTSAYIEKNKPFIYRCSNERKVCLYYKFEENRDYAKMEMEYKAFGVFSAVLPVFYNEKVDYYFSEEMPTGSINTNIESFTNTRVLLKNDARDIYFLINNALVYNSMFKYDETEKIITGLLKEKENITGKIL